MGKQNENIIVEDALVKSSKRNRHLYLEKRSGTDTDRRSRNQKQFGPERRTEIRRERDLRLKAAQEEAQGKLWTAAVTLAFTAHVALIVATIV